MFYTRKRSTLQLHLPEGWPSSRAADDLFCYAWYTDRSRETGIARLPEIPHATTTVVVAPAGAVHFVRVSLPEVGASKTAALLPFAVEDATATAPEDSHAVLVEEVRGGTSLVAVVNREWLTVALQALEAQGLRPARLIVETELAAQLAATETTHPWIVVWSPCGGFACLRSGQSIALDLGEGNSSLPLALRLARNTNRRRDEIPGEVLVYTAPGTSTPNLEAWGRLLDLPVRHRGEWRPELIDGRELRATDLLRGTFASKQNAKCMCGSVKVAAGVAAGVLGLHVLLTLGDWWRLSSEARERRAQMEAQFREVFPDAQAIVDAPLQMQRGLNQLRQQAGIPDASDFIPLLAAVAPALTSAALQTDRLRYDRGALELDVAVPAGEGRDSIEKRLAVSGHRIEVRSISAGPSGEIARVRVSAES